MSSSDKQKLIIHTDRGTQFSSKAYNTFTKKYKKYFIPSMSRENTPTDNSVAERFMRTFKNHKIYNTTIEEKLSNSIAIDPNFRSYKATLNKLSNNSHERFVSRNITFWGVVNIMENNLEIRNFGIELSSQEVPPQVLSSIYNVSQLSSRWISVVPLSTLKTPKQN